MPRLICPVCGETGEGHADTCTDLLRPVHDEQDREASHKVNAKAVPEPEEGINSMAHRKAYA